MDTGRNHPWRPLTAETIAGLPQAGAVFEVATLVRTVHFIGAAGGNLRARLVSFTQEQVKHVPVPGGYYIRYEQATVEEEVLAKRLATYRARHGGLLPVGNRETAPALRVASRHAA